MTARRRASERANPFAAGFAVPDKVAAAGKPVSGASLDAPEARKIKYTALLDDDTVDAFEQLTRAARRRLQRNVDKVEVMKALIMLAADDVSLRDQMIEEVSGRRETTTAE